MSLLQYQMDDGLLIIRFNDSELLDEAKAFAAGKQLYELISEAKSGGMLLDFSNVAKLSSVMIGQLFTLNNRCKAAGVDLKLCSLSPLIKELLDIVQLTNFVQAYEDEDAAWEAFHQEFNSDSIVDENGAASTCRQAAEQGDPASQFDLGARYDIGNGVTQDADAAFNWYRKAAEQGHTEAQFMLGKSYAYGIHVKQDFAEAAKWYQKAAEQGHREAQYVVGMSHQYGIAGNEDKVEAARWYQMAAEQGHKPAEDALRELPTE